MRRFLPALLLFLPSAAFARIETVVVTATPLSTSAAGPTASSTLDAADLSLFGPANAIAALDRTAPGIALISEDANPFNPDISYRGFEASPLAGDAQGLAVYANGARFSQPFGDTVAFDLLPDIAIQSLTLEGANPTFGLNALAGSLSARFKNGFAFEGGVAQASFGSHALRDGEFGGHSDTLSYYAAARLLSDGGWRDHSPSSLHQAFADVGWRGGDDTELHLWILGASNALTGNGTAPVELLAVDRSAVFTWPDTTFNRFGMLGATAHTVLNSELTLDGSAYLSALRQRTLNGDVSDLEPCGADLCLDDGTLATDTLGNPIPDFLAGGEYAQLNRTATSSTASGATLQLDYKTTNIGMAAGASLDHGVSAFGATSEVGELTDDRGFAGPGIVIAIPGGPIEPVNVKARNTYIGLYATATVALSDALSATASARFNRADIALEDRLGTSLSGTHRYGRLNPALGLTWAVSSNTSFYAGYSEANRTPTPAELSCADASSPCSLTNFFVADPDLKQVTSRTWEAGARGAASLAGGKLDWQANLFRSDTQNEILLTSSAILGRAFFQNVPATRRQGADASIALSDDVWTGSLAYAWTMATFETPLTLQSPDNPHADAGGDIHVVPGDRMPDVPAHGVKLLVDYHPAQRWSVSLAMRGSSGHVLKGDESNLNPPTDPFVVFDLAGRLRVLAHAELFASITNLFDRRYATFGAFSPTDAVPIAEAPGATNPRSLSPAPPREFTLGLRLSL